MLLPVAREPVRPIRIIFVGGVWEIGGLCKRVSSSSLFLECLSAFIENLFYNINN